MLDIPVEVDQEVAILKLEAMGIQCDTITERQHQYLTGWKEGTG